VVGVVGGMEVATLEEMADLLCKDTHDVLSYGDIGCKVSNLVEECCSCVAKVQGS
jgi:hypothetical protein